MNPNKDKMHPEDKRNLVIFFALSILLWLSYDIFVLKPQREAVTQAQTSQQQAQLENNMVAPVSPSGTGLQPLPRQEALTADPRVEIMNAELQGSLSLIGGKIDDLALRNYFVTLDKEEKVVLLSPQKTEHPRFVKYGWVAEDSAVPVPGAETFWRIAEGGKLTPETPVTLQWDNGQGLTFERRLSIDDQHMIAVEQRVQNNTGRTMTLYPYALISQKGLPPGLEGGWLLNEGLIGHIGDTLVENTYKQTRKEGSKTLNANQGWIGLNEKYWLTSIIPQQGAQTNFRFSVVPRPPVMDEKGKERDNNLYQVDYTGPAFSVSPGETAQYKSHSFVGAKKVLQLEQYGRQMNIPHFDLAVNFGWFWFLSKPFFYILHYLGEYIGNLGFAIIILTIIIRSAVFPLTNASYKSFAKMKKVAPQMMELRQKHGDDKQALQKEMVKLYEREGVNPMAGCVPILLQIPIFFALYKVLFVTIEVRHAPFIGWIEDLSAQDPTSLFNLFGLIPWTPPELLMIGAWPCMMLLVMLVQKNLNPPPQDPIQRDMAIYFPFVITFVMSKFAAGLVIYWTFSAFISVLQQMIIMRSMNVPIHLFGQTKEEKELEESLDKGPSVYPLTEMAEEDVEEALFGKEDAPEKPITPPKKKTSKKRGKKKK